MSAPWDTALVGPSPGAVPALHGSSSWIASPALKGTIVLAQCRSWLLAEEEARCRAMLNHINTDKHAIKTSLHTQSEGMQTDTNHVKAELAALRAKEEKLRRELDESSTTYLRLYRDPKVSRGNDAMLREKQRSNELWNDLETLIHERNAANTRLQQLEASNMLIIQNLYQTQVLLATQVEKERQRMGGDESEEDARAKQRQHRLSRSTSMLSSSASSNGAGGAPADDQPSSPSVIQPVSPVDAKIADEVSRLTSLRNSEINLQKKLSKFLGLREQVQSYLLKIAGFQKKLAAQQMQQAQARAIRQLMKNSSSAPSSGRQSPSSSAPPSPGRAHHSNSILKQSFGSGANSQPITIGAQGGQTHQRRDSGSGVHSVFRPSPDTPEQGSAVPDAGAASSVSPPSSSSASPSPHAHMSAPPHQLLVPRPGSAASSTASASPAVPARSLSPTTSTSPSAASSPSRGVAASSSRAQPSSNSSGASSLSGSSPAPSLLLSSHGRSASQSLQSMQPPPQLATSSSTQIAPPPAASSASSTFNAERDRIEKSQLAHLVFDQRNRKVLQRICEAFHRSGLPSARKWKAGRKAAAASFGGSGGIVIQNAFLGVEMITWILNIGLSAQRADALILLELLLRAGLIDMIQESSESTEENVSASGGGGGGLASLRINARSQFGDMKLQFALYRLRGDSSDAGKLSKSGWLFKVSRWRVHRRYFAWDVDVHRLALFHSNKDENPARVYYLGASTVISAVEDATAAQQAAAAAAQAAAAAAGRDGSAPAVPSLVRGASAGSSSTPAGMIPPDSLSKFYFQLHLHPPQNDESSLLLYASSARERAEWLKVLWLSGCEYPTLASTVHANQGFVTNKPGQPGAGVAPGSRPNPIHPSVLLGAQQPLHNHHGSGSSAAATAAIHQSILGHASSASAHSALDSETDDEADEEDTYYEDVAEEDEQATGQQGDSDEMRHQRPRYAADDASGGPMLRATFTRGSSVSSAPPAARSGSLASASFSSFSSLPSGSGGSGAPTPTNGGLRRRASLADKKNESDLMGVFALRRAKAKFALAAAWTKMLDTRRRNLDKRSKMRGEQRRIAAEERAAAIAKAAQPQFLGSPSSATAAAAASSAAASSISSNGAAASDLPPLPSADGLDLGWCEMFVPGYDSADDDPESAAASVASRTATTGGRGSRSSSPSRASSVSKSDTPAGPGSLDVVVVDSEDEDEGNFDDDDDDLGQDGDQSGDSEGENEELFRAASLSVMTADAGTTQPAEATATATTDPQDPEQARSQLRKQRFQLLSNSLSSLLQLPAAPVAATPASSSSSADAAASSSPAPPALHPLTSFVSTYVRQFVELYTGALELSLANPAASASAAAGAVKNPWVGTNSAWPPAHRASGTNNGAFLPQFGAASDAQVPRAREKLELGSSSEHASQDQKQPSPLDANDSAAADQAKAAADDDLPPSPPVLYPYSRHSRAVLAAAKEDVRQLLYQLNQVVADALAVCETALRKEAERERKVQAAADKKAGVVAKRASSRRTDPAIRRIERDLSLLSRLCSQLLSHQVFTLVYSALFPLYAAVHARRNGALQAQIFNHRALTFKQMGLAEELIFSAAANTDTQGTETEGQAISYQHAIDAFRSLSRLSSPIDKLSCVVSVAKAICACVDQAKVQAQARAQAAEAAAAAASGCAPSGSSSAVPASHPSPVVIGADDLLLLFAYLLIHSRVRDLVAELSFLSDFIPEHQRCTMQGYYLATTQAAAELLASDELQQTIAQREAAAAAAAASAHTDDDAAAATSTAAAASDAVPVTTPLVPLDPPAPASQPALPNDVGALGALEEKVDSEARR